MKFVNHIYEKYRNSLYRKDFSNYEIDHVEEKRKQKFPGGYKEFSSCMGKQVSFFKGLDYSMYDLEVYRGDLEETRYQNFKEDGLNFLKKSDLVFLSSQACNWNYMPLNKGDNPPVYLINEPSSKLGPIRTYSTFVEFLMYHSNFGNTRKEVQKRWLENKQ